MSDIFLAYASEDRERVRPLVAALESTGWSVFWDRTIPAGLTWRDFITEQMRDARCFVVAWTTESVKSQYVLEEEGGSEEQRASYSVPAVGK